MVNKTWLKLVLLSGLRCLFSSNTALLTDRSNVAMQKRHFKAVFLFYSQQKQQKKLHSPSCSTSAWFFSSLVPLLVTGTHAVHSRSSWFWVDSLIICNYWKVKRSSFSLKNLISYIKTLFMPLTCPSLVSMVFISTFFDMLSITGLVSFTVSAGRI